MVITKNKNYRNFLTGKARLPVPEINHRIPKIIHYCWFGRREMDEREKACIESWKEHCPGYELKMWSENNYFLSLTPLYVRQAYEARNFNFVNGYARLDIIYQHGGFYLGTDVLLRRSLDAFSKYRAVFGYLARNEINFGLGFGSVAGNKELLEQMRRYEQTLFPDDGETTLSTRPDYTTDYYRLKRMHTDFSLKLINDTLFLPTGFL